MMSSVAGISRTVDTEMVVCPFSEILRLKKEFPSMEGTQGSVTENS